MSVVAAVATYCPYCALQCGINVSVHSKGQWLTASIRCGISSMA
jgi:hypothetical protein